MPQTSKRRFLLAGLLVLLATAAALGYWRFGRAAEVSIATAQSGEITARVLGPGTVQARTAVSVAARVNATVTQVLVDVGDVVTQGQLLVTLDDRELAARRAAVGGQQQALARNTEAARAALAKAQADLDLARSKQRRDAELLAQGFVSQAVVDASNAALRAGQAGVDAARATLAAREADAVTLAQEARAADVGLTHARLLSPLDGLVIERLAEPGSTVTLGMPILKLVDPQTLWVATRVDESVVGRVQVGQPASIRMRTGQTVAGKVARIARRSDAATRELDVFVAFDELPRHFAIDQQAEVGIDTGAEPGIVVPTQALTRDVDGRQGVLLVVDGRTRFQPVQTGGADEHGVLVRSGLETGQALVADSAGVRANQAVRAAVRP
ncbi:MAG: efflux RND transporter periplasmic adaptor subunit [Rhodoferax sp.]|nr:efflux RND transporter periplasmic adaptor subunit [Rhodoferax sp.]MCP5290721.1 efflux RND transporter periplasmic adaptor subunit [Burkholderiaceae bacterium]